ncbi:MAG: glycosyl hydrolase [Gemmataceae bacterium]
MLLLLLCLSVAPPVPGPIVESTPGLVARNIGPAPMGGRIPSLDVVRDNPKIQYIAAAGGGIWKTTDEGKTWSCVFSGAPHASMGAVAIAPSDPDTVYVGTGEGNLRNSVSWGNGVFITRDAGKTWNHIGLHETKHIGRIAVHPRDAKIAFVAAVGRAWGPNPERGLFRTRDAGQTWEHVLKLDADTGCIDVVIDPREPKYVYAAAYRVRRGAYMGGNPAVQFGPLAGIYRSTDGGATFERCKTGLPSVPCGRIGLCIYEKNPRVVFAVIQTQKTDSRQLAGQPATAANRAIGPVDTGGIFRSEDHGESWTKINDLVPRPFYFGKIRVDPTDEKRIWVLGIPLNLSTDGGRTFRNGAGRNVHVDHHALWINPRDPNHLVLGNDGGLYYSRNGGTDWIPIRNLPISQFYSVVADLQTPYRVYGGLQDNGSWMGPSRSANAFGVTNSDWKRLYGMDGFYCQVPPDDPFTAYAEGQYGRLVRIDLRTMKATTIRPRVPAGKPDYRYNWSSPLLVSPHDSRTLYFAGNVVFKSSNSGFNWQVISPDLTRGELGQSYPSSGHTITALSESPVRAGQLFAGTDDGKLHRSTDDGKSWIDLTDRLKGLPASKGNAATAHLTRIEQAPYDEKTLFVTLDRRRQNDERPYVYRSRDGGETFERINGTLPFEGPVHVVRADAKNRGLLFAGTEFGLFVSFDEGDRWQAFACGLPPVAVHDLHIQPKENELVIATHGRGVWIVDIAPLQALTPDVRQEAVTLFAVRPGRWPGRPGHPPENSYAGGNPEPGLNVYYRLRKELPQPGRLELWQGEMRVRETPSASRAGLHRQVWKMDDLKPGVYEVRLLVGAKTLKQAVRVPETPNFLKAAEE